MCYWWAAGDSGIQPMFITICIYARLPWYVWNELIPNLISQWFLADLFWPEARKNKRQERTKVGLPVPCEQRMGLFAELFLFPSVRATTKAAEPWPECMWESNWSTEGEDGAGALWLEERETQQRDAEAHISDTACPSCGLTFRRGSCTVAPNHRSCRLGQGCLSNWSHPAGHVGVLPASSDVSMDGGRSCRWHVQSVGGWMKHACESQHRRTSTRLIMTSFQAEFIMHSPLCCHYSKCREREETVGRIRQRESINGLINLGNTTDCYWECARKHPWKVKIV